MSTLKFIEPDNMKVVDDKNQTIGTLLVIQEAWIFSPNGTMKDWSAYTLRQIATKLDGLNKEGAIPARDSAAEAMDYETYGIAKKP